MAPSEPSEPGAPPATEPAAAPTEPEREPTDEVASDDRDGTHADSEKPDTVDPDLLAGDDTSAASVPPPTTPRRTTSGAELESPEAHMLVAYDAAYRPADNPGRLNISARLLFANAGGDGDVGGRLGGAQVDVGQAWNRFGYALTASAWGGSVTLNDRVSEMNAVFGAGPTLTYGRTALQHRGIIDFRVGYDFMYGVVNRASDTTLVATTGNSNVVVEVADNLLPHGPRAVLQLGLLGQRKRDYHHGFGIVFGYQGLVGSLRGELPFTHMLVTGLQWWMG